MALSFTYCNFCRPHMTVTRQAGGIKRTPFPGSSRMDTLEARYGGFGTVVIIVGVVAVIAAVVILARIRRGSPEDRTRALRVLWTIVLPLVAAAVVSLLRERH